MHEPNALKKHKGEINGRPNKLCDRLASSDTDSLRNNGERLCNIIASRNSNNSSWHQLCIHHNYRSDNRFPIRNEAHSDKQKLEVKA
jgi:hypothetical protein